MGESLMGPLIKHRPHQLDNRAYSTGARCIGNDIQRMLCCRQGEYSRFRQGCHRGTLHNSWCKTDPVAGIQYRRRKDIQEIRGQPYHHIQCPRLPRPTCVLERRGWILEYDSRCRTADEHLLIYKPQGLEARERLWCRVWQPRRCMGMSRPHEA